MSLNRGHILQYFNRARSKLPLDQLTGSLDTKSSEVKYSLEEKAIHGSVLALMRLVGETYWNQIISKAANISDVYSRHSYLNDGLYNSVKNVIQVIDFYISAAPFYIAAFKNSKIGHDFLHDFHHSLANIYFDFEKYKNKFDSPYSKIRIPEVIYKFGQLSECLSEFAEVGLLMQGYGDHMIRHKDVALTSYTAAAKDNYLKAQFKLYLINERELTQSKRLIQFKDIKALADAGDSEAQYHVSLMFEEGFPVKQDLKLAQAFFEKSFVQGNPKAITKMQSDKEIQKNHAHFLQAVKDDPKMLSSYSDNFSKAETDNEIYKNNYTSLFVGHLKLASREGNGEASFYLGKLIDSDRYPHKAIIYFVRATKQGFEKAKEALYELALRKFTYEFTLDWLDHIDCLTFKYGWLDKYKIEKLNDIQYEKDCLRVAADLGLASARTLLGKIYLTDGIFKEALPDGKKNKALMYHAALPLFKKAAEEGDLEADIHLGLIYLNGISGEPGLESKPNHKLAATHFIKAFENTKNLESKEAVAIRNFAVKSLSNICQGHDIEACYVSAIALMDSQFKPDVEIYFKKLLINSPAQVANLASYPIGNPVWNKMIAPLLNDLDPKTRSVLMEERKRTMTMFQKIIEDTRIDEKSNHQNITHDVATTIVSYFEGEEKPLELFGLFSGKAGVKSKLNEEAVSGLRMCVS